LCQDIHLSLADILAPLGMVVGSGLDDVRAVKR
jgi:hypothetical protein